MSYFGYKKYFSEKAVEEYFLSSGYNICSIVRFMKNYFGFSSGSSIQNKYLVTSAFLRAKLVYLDEELPTVQNRMAELLNYIESCPRSWYFRSPTVLFDTSVLHQDGSLAKWDRYSREIERTQVLGFFEIKERFRKIVDSKLDKLVGEIGECNVI